MFPIGWHAEHTVSSGGVSLEGSGNFSSGTY